MMRYRYESFRCNNNELDLRLSGYEEPQRGWRVHTVAWRGDMVDVLMEQRWEA